MKKITVYKLVNDNGIVEYVGQSKCPDHRFKQHTIEGIGWKKGKFIGRTDITFEIIEEVYDIKEAHKREAYWQEFYGFIPEHKQARLTYNSKSEEEKQFIKDKIYETVHSDPIKLKEAHDKRWITINADPDKKKESFEKMIESRYKDPEDRKRIAAKQQATMDADPEKKKEKYNKIRKSRNETFKNMDPEKKKEMYRKMWETRRNKPK